MNLQEERAGWWQPYEACRQLLSPLAWQLPDLPNGQACVYAIQCQDNSVYIGYTQNLTRRWREHLSGSAARWTKKHKPLGILDLKLVQSRKEAQQLEREWKTPRGRYRIKKLVEKQIVALDGAAWNNAKPARQRYLLEVAEERLAAQPEGVLKLHQAVRTLAQALGGTTTQPPPPGLLAHLEFYQAVLAQLPDPIQA